MRKIILGLFLILLIPFSSFADKQVTFDDVSSVNLYGEFNAPQEDNYYPLSLQFKCMVNSSATGISMNISDKIYLGQPSETKYTPQELYTWLSNAIGVSVADKLKDLYISGINEDISN